MKSILLVGLGKFGMMVAKNLHEMGHEVMAIDRNEEHVNEAMPFLTDAVIGDSTNQNILKSLGVNDYDVCLVTIGSDFQSSLETTSLLKELGAKKVVSRAEREVQEKFLLRNGADEVVYPIKQVAKWTAITYSSEFVLDYIRIDSNHAIYEVTVPENWCGKSISQIDIRKKYGINIMAIKENGEMQMTVLPDTVLKLNQTLLVLGEHKAIQKCFRI